MITADSAKDIPLSLVIDRTNVHFRAQRGCWGDKVKAKAPKPESLDDLSGLITVNEAAKILRVKEVTVRSYVNKYGLTRIYRRVGGGRSRLVLSAKEVKKLVKNLNKKHPGGKSCKRPPRSTN